MTPPEVAIDEAVRLAKRYSTDEAGAFVNGVLGGVVRAGGRGAAGGSAAGGRRRPAEERAGGGEDG